jgi:hypothetical protein
MSAEALHINTSFTAFDGWEIPGQVDTVLMRGQDLIRSRSSWGSPVLAGAFSAGLRYEILQAQHGFG